MQKQEQQTQYTVSSTTGEFIECIKSVDSTSNQIYQAMENICGVNVDEIMEKEVYPLTSKLNALIGKYMFASISENLSMLDNKGKLI